MKKFPPKWHVIRMQLWTSDSLGKFEHLDILGGTPFCAEIAMHCNLGLWSVQARTSQHASVQTMTCQRSHVQYIKRSKVIVFTSPHLGRESFAVAAGPSSMHSGRPIVPTARQMLREEEANARLVKNPLAKLPSFQVTGHNQLLVNDWLTGLRCRPTSSISDQSIGTGLRDELSAISVLF